jgi:FAD binding domain
MLRSDISAILYGLNSRRSRFSVRPPPGAASFELAANQLGHFGHIVQYELELRLAVTVEQLGDLRRIVRIKPVDVAFCGGAPPWAMSSWTAERYRCGPVFLAGDSAHVMPPVGGFGANTGIQDAHNLCAKLGQVIRAEASEGILASYDEERRPVGRMTVDQATLRLAGRSEIRREPNEEQPVLSERAVTLGYRYRSATIMSEGHDGGIAADPRSRKGEPGTRAAHVVLQRNGTAIFALDLFGRRPVLIAGSAASRAAAAAAAGRIGIATDCYGLNADLGDPAGRLLDAYGIAPDGAVLVRPGRFCRLAHASAGRRHCCRSAAAMQVVMGGRTLATIATDEAADKAPGSA